jgi:Fuc2NAc and GlcNAc transferase
MRLRLPPTVMTLALLLPILAGLTAWMLTGWIYRRAEHLRLVEIPNHRSSHEYPTPSGGGTAIVLASLPVVLWTCLGGSGNYWLVPALALLIAVVGLWDDLRQLPKRLRFFVQLLASGVVVYGLSPIQETSTLALFLAPILVITGIWWINLFNFMDGIDGIAGSQAIFMLGTAALTGAWLHPEAVTSPAWLWMLAIAAATLGFLWHNWAPARIFMGDVGSTYLGFMILALACLSVTAGWLSPPFWLILGALFISDASVTLLRRMATGQRWLEAHRSHAYQRLAKRWRSHARATGLSIAINQLWLAPLAWLTLLLPDWSGIFILLAYLPLVAGCIALDAGKPDR